MRLVLICALLLLASTSGYLRRCRDLWHCEGLELDKVLDKRGLEVWLARTGLLFSYEQIDFLHATLQDLAYLPLVFYEEYATVEQFKQIWPVVEHQEQLPPHLAEIKRMASAFFPHRPENSIDIPRGGDIPWRRSEGLSSDESSGDDLNSNTGADVQGDDDLMFPITD